MDNFRQPPAENQPARQPPTENQPARQPPTENQPARQPPTENQPARQPPTENQPAHQQPLENQPPRQPPLEIQPSVQQPTVIQSPTANRPKGKAPHGSDGKVLAAPAKYNMLKDAEALSQAESWAQRTLKKGVQGLTDDFAQLKHYMPEGVSKKAYDAHPDKNRYPDVWCEDKTRVVLKFPPGRSHDYIHANYVATPNFHKRFICTQGPLPNTVTDFWSMVIQEECECILMLCNVEENGQPKCAQYWPMKEGEKLAFDNQVELVNLEVKQPPPNTKEHSLRKTTLEIKYPMDGKSCSRKVRHFHWIDWPDRGVPKTSLTAMVLLSCVRGSKHPIAIHCAAGIGRTGSITSIEYVIEHFTDGKSCEDMVDVVKGLRQQRLSSIQNSQQYLYIHRVLLMYFMDKYKAVAQSPEFIQLYDQFKADYEKLPGVNH